MSDKPQEKLYAKIWFLFTKGKRGYLTIPLFLLFVVLTYLPDTKQKVSQSIDIVKETLYPTTYMTRDEFDICNEYIAVIWSFEGLENAEKGLVNFREAYKEADKSLTWENDIYLVRALNRKNGWQIVIDMDHDISNEKTISERLRKLKQIGDKNRQTRNSLGNWLDATSVELYDIEKFEYTHGKIANVRNECIQKAANKPMQPTAKASAD